MCSDLTLGSPFKVKQVLANLELLFARLSLILEVYNMKTTYIKP